MRKNQIDKATNLEANAYAASKELVTYLEKLFPQDTICKTAIGRDVMVVNMSGTRPGYIITRRRHDAQRERVYHWTDLSPLA